MKIITKKHWLGWNSNDKEVSDWAMKSSDENFKIYAERLEKLRPRLKERNYEFFKKGLHDGRLISFSVGEGLHLKLENNPLLTLRDFSKTRVWIKVINGEFDAIYDLKYERVSKVVFDFPSDLPIFSWNSIDDWGYDEISEVDENILRHEVLFSSGSTILIEFEKFSFKKKKYKEGRY
jgi:hypothetical protein